MTNLTNDIGDLTPEKRELLELLLKEEGINFETTLILPKDRVWNDEFNGYLMPLSYAQQRLWFLDLLEPGSPVYNIPTAVRLIGALDIEVLEKSINHVVERHESLRTKYRTIDDAPFQLIVPELRVKLNSSDLTNLPEDKDDPIITELIREEAQQPFDLINGPLLRAKLLIVQPEESFFLLTMHHIISDGWSIGVLIHEIVSYYDAFTRGETAVLPVLPVQYSDFAIWQREWLQGDLLESQLSYWKSQLGSDLPVLQLPTDNPRPALQTSRGASASFELNGRLKDEIILLGKHEGCTLFMTLIGAFAVLLSIYSRQDDICIGTPVANRNRKEIENLIGFFVNTLVLRMDLSGSQTFKQLLQHIRKVALDAYSNQDVPFEMLVEKLQPNRELSHTPLFQVMFVLQNTPPQAINLPNLNLQPVETHSGTATFDLTLIMAETKNGFSGVLEYNTDLFNHETIQRMIHHFKFLLQAVSKNPAQIISHIPLLSQQELRKILKQWNETKRKIPSDLCLHHLFEIQVGKTPDNEAVVQPALSRLNEYLDNDITRESLTYSELNRRSNQLAHYLIKKGVGPEAIIGIIIERSIDMIVGILGILKAGGAYLPIDPSYPTERVKFMLSDVSKFQSGDLWVLTQSSIKESIPHTQDHIISIDSDWDRIALCDVSNPSIEVRSNNLAYIIYTSGSTGKPKGVMISHRSALNHNIFMAREFGLVANDRALQFASISFDASVEEIFPTLHSGSTLVLRPQLVVPSSQELLNLILAEDITVLNFPTAYWHEFTSELFSTNTSLPESVRLVVIGGEKAQREIFDIWRKIAGEQTILFNDYGPTETSIASTYIVVPTDVEAWKYQYEIPIGIPIDNVYTYILNEYLQPVPVGVPGELFVGGEAIARGYLNHPEKTAISFIPDPFIDNGRIYRTGDLVRYRPDGNIDFLGRADNQVKLRGYRVELGEIESVILQHPEVNAAVVIIREDSPGVQQLVAYITSEVQIQNNVPESSIIDGEKVKHLIADLRDYLNDELPEYMVPATIVVLSNFPLTPNNKIDRRVLPEPDYRHIRDKSALVLPRTPDETLLANVWTHVLGIPEIGVNDNFFELGGHSLLATRVVSRTSRAFGLEIPLRYIFDSPTIAGMARSINDLRLISSSVSLPTIKPVAREGEMPLSFGQQRLWFLGQLEPGSAVYNIPDAVRVDGELNIPALEDSLNEIIRRHEVLRTVFISKGGKPVQVIAPELQISLPIIDLTGFHGEKKELKVKRYVVEESQRSFDLQRGPLIRASVLQLSINEWIVLFTMHHIVSDGWSSTILIGEVAKLYPVYSKGRPVEEIRTLLPELAIQYADYAHWQREWLSGETLNTQLSYWIEQLHGVPPLLDLPTDHPRPAVQTSRGVHYTFDLSRTLTDDIRKLGQERDVTLFMLLLAAFQSLLFRYSGQADISVGTPIANRNRPEIEGMIGFFVNTLVIRTVFSKDSSFSEILKQVRENSLDAYAYQDIPFEMLVDAIQPERDLSHTPLFQAMFLMQNISEQEILLPELKITTLDLDTEISMFDITLVISEMEDGFFAGVEYNIDLFERTSIVRMMNHFERLLENIVRYPEMMISQIPLLSAEEEWDIIVNWNQTEVDYPRNRCLHSQFEEQVVRTPDAIAVISGNETVTYDELNRRANQLAHYLRSQGVGSEALVGVSMDRSVEMMVGLIGILKAGGAYVPLDPSYPSDRLSYVIMDANVRIILTNERVRKHITKLETQIITVDSDWERISREGEHNPTDMEVSAGNLAYVIYTSGSTGIPKGVMVEHQSVVNHNFAVINDYGITPEDRVLQFATINFDTAVEEIFPTWLAGATLVLRNDDVLLSAEELNSLVDIHGITLLNLPTAYWHEWVYELLMANQRLPDSLRLVVIGGEKCLKERYENWLQVSGDPCDWLNTYGPTEATIISSLYEPQTDLDQLSEVPIGRPIANTRLYIMDEYLQAVPVGVRGELCIGGEGVTRGYLNSSISTATQFVPDPYSENPGSRMYRTGDLVRYLPDGNIEFSGRVDHQVKVRGFRIELGEIDAALTSVPDVKEAVTVAALSEADHLRLVAYIVPSIGVNSADEEALVKGIRDGLGNKLPDYMIPNKYIFLDELPRTPSQKIDRSALPEPEEEAVRGEREFVPPRTPEEELLSKVWCDVLGLSQVSVNDNFFELGGDSILSIQVIARSGMDGIRLTPRQLFENPTVAGLASVAGRGGIIEAEQGLVEGEVVLTPIQQWFFDQNFLNSDYYNQALLLEVRQSLNYEHLKDAVTALIAHHDALRMRYEFEDVKVRQLNTGLDEDTNLKSCLRIDISDVNETELSAVIEKRAIEVQSSLRLTGGPIFRVALFDLGNDKPSRVLIVGHHLVIDGVSWRILLEDLQSAYVQISAGKEVHLPPKTTSFKQWAEDLKQYAGSEELTSAISYWRNYRSAEVGRLRVDNISGINTEEYAESVSVSLTEEETQALLYEVPKAYQTEINDILLAGIAQVLERWTGKPSIMVEMEGHGREDLFNNLDVSRTVGWFTTMYPVLLRMRGFEDIGKLIKSVKEQLREIPQNGISYGIMKSLAVEDIRSQMAEVPQPEVSFNYLGQFDQVLPDDGIFRIARESRGTDRDKRTSRSTILDVTGGILGGRLSLEWSFSTDVIHKGKVKKIANDYIDRIKQIIEHCRTPEAEGFTPSDFPLAGLDQKNLDTLLGKIKK